MDFETNFDDYFSESDEDYVPPQDSEDDEDAVVAEHLFTKNITITGTIGAKKKHIPNVMNDKNKAEYSLFFFVFCSRFCSSRLCKLYS